MTLDDSARFRVDDPLALVAASFACPLCLRRASLVFLDEDEGEHSATCRCALCDKTWTVALGADQFLRVKLLPPRELLVLVSASGEGDPYWRFPV
jgi:hypothetical protein